VSGLLCVCATAMVCDRLPSPLQMTADRAEKLLSTRRHSFGMMPLATQQLKHGTSTVIVVCLHTVITESKVNCVIPREESGLIVLCICAAC